MTEYVAIGSIKVAQPIFELVTEDVAPGTGIPAESVWTLLEEIIACLLVVID